MKKWFSRKLWLAVCGCGTIVCLGLTSAVKPIVGWQITIVLVVGIIAFAYLDGKEK